MIPHYTRSSRREFFRRSASSVAGLVAGTMITRYDSVDAAPADDRFELSIHQYSLKKLFEDGTLDTAGYAEFVHQQFGFTSLEFAVEFCQPLRDDLERADQIAARSKQLGIKHRALLCGASPSLDAPTRRERQAAVADHLEWAEVAKRLECQFIRVRASGEGDRKEQLDHAAEGITALCDALNDSKVSVLVENIAGWSRDPDWLVDLIKRVGRQRLGLIADFGNFDGDIYAGMKRLVPLATSICTKSWDFDDEGNETKIDFARMISIIKESSFRGCIAIEYLGDDPVAGVRKTADLITRLI